MQQVKIKKSELTSRITANRDAHRGLYEKAMEGYRDQVTVWFHEQLDRLSQGKGYSTSFNLPRPEDHTADYDTVLDMLDMSVDDEIVLHHREFQQYVRDDWGWRQEFMATASNYVAR